VPRSLGLGSSVFYSGRKFREARTDAVQCGRREAVSENAGGSSLAVNLSKIFVSGPASRGGSVGASAHSRAIAVSATPFIANKITPFPVIVAKGGRDHLERAR
jgi:hypothetical protein